MEIRSVEVRHASAAVERRVRAWFETASRIGAVDGGRSVHLPHPEKRGVSLKIKGAGDRGGPIRFGTRLNNGPVAPRFDFDGRMMVDIASGHDNAFVGGASFQQTATEFRMAATFAELGIPVVPCVGYGRVATDAHVSWFSLHEWPRGYADIVADETDSYRLVNLRLSELMLDLAVNHGKIGYFWFARGPGQQDLAFDLHPFVQLDPLSASQLSWVMHLAYAYYIRCRACEVFPAKAGVRNLSPDIAAFPLRGLLADANHADYTDLRTWIIRPSKRLGGEQFSSSTLAAMLKASRVGSALLERCPESYTRWA